MGHISNTLLARNSNSCLACRWRCTQHRLTVSCRPRRSTIIRAANSSLHEDSDKNAARSVVDKGSVGDDVRKTAVDDFAMHPRRTLIKFAAGAVATSLCPCCTPGIAKASEWGYDYENGPLSWGGVCSTGTHQSPIDLIKNDDVRIREGDIKFGYKVEKNAKIFNTGHGTMQVNLPAGHMCKVGGKTLELVQFHFHTPSEHTINHKRGSMEVHLVHRNTQTGGLAVLGAIMQRSGDANKGLAEVLKFAPSSVEDPVKFPSAINLMDFVPKMPGNNHRAYYHYQGSLTTPPCSENVEWFVFAQPIPVSDKQVVDFEHYIGSRVGLARNSRPIQKLEEREVEIAVKICDDI